MSQAVVPQPSPWVRRFAALVRRGGTVLDLACGMGRNARLFLDRGHGVVCVDRDVSGVADLGSNPEVEIVAADLERSGTWPLEGRAFAAVVVTNYLRRPLMTPIMAALEPGGILIYETFAVGNERFGHPRNPAFLLRPGELLELVGRRLLVIAYEHGLGEDPNRPRVVQRVCAANGGPADTLLVHPLFPE